MKTVYDVQKLLMKFGAIIYTGNRIGDLELMEIELDELFHHQFVRNDEYTQAKLLLKKEASRLTVEKGEIT